MYFFLGTQPFFLLTEYSYSLYFNSQIPGSCSIGRAGLPMSLKIPNPLLTIKKKTKKPLNISSWKCKFFFQPLVAPSSHPMAPPSPSTNNNNGSSSSTPGWDQLSKTNLYIRGLSPSTTDHDLVKLCQPWVPHFLSSLSAIDRLLIGAWLRFALVWRVWRKRTKCAAYLNQTGNRLWLRKMCFFQKFPDLTWNIHLGKNELGQQ